MKIVLNNIIKEFSNNLTGQMISLFKILTSRNLLHNDQKNCIRAVNDVSLTINEGECVGFIGKNGAGKTTLLQMIAGLAETSSGSMEIDGNVTCIMTLGVGLKEELSGRKNIYIDAEINGISKKETEKKLDDIVNFADIGEHIDMPVKTYSSGMKARLSFSMLIHLEPEILIIDEALSVGDYKFSTKSSQKMKEISKKGKILIIVSHNLEAIKTMCTRCIWLNKGRIVMDGNPEDVTAAYRKFIKEEDEKIFLRNYSKRISGSSEMEGMEITSIRLLNGKEKTHLFHIGDNLVFEMEFTKEKSSEKELSPYLIIERTDGIRIAETQLNTDNSEINISNGTFRVITDLGNIIWGKGNYIVIAEIRDSANCPKAFNIDYFRVDNNIDSIANPIFFPETQWSAEEIAL